MKKLTALGLSLLMSLQLQSQPGGVIHTTKKAIATTLSKKPGITSMKNLQGIDTTNIQNYTLTYINKLRQSKNLPPVQRDANLHTTAQSYAQYMYDNNHFNHKDKQGRGSYERISEQFPDIYQESVENIAFGAQTVQAVLEQRTKSILHKNNMLHQDLVYIGLAQYQGYRVLHLASKK